VSPIPEICPGESVQLMASGGTTYQWYPSEGLSDTTIANPIATPMTTSTYVVNVIDAAGCSDSSSVTVIVKPDCLFQVTSVSYPNQMNSDTNQVVICFNESIDTSTLNINTNFIFMGMVSWTGEYSIQGNCLTFPTCALSCGGMCEPIDASFIIYGEDSMELLGEPALQSSSGKVFDGDGDGMAGGDYSSEVFTLISCN